MLPTAKTHTLALVCYGDLIEFTEDLPVSYVAGAPHSESFFYGDRAALEKLAASYCDPDPAELPETLAAIRDYTEADALHEMRAALECVRALELDPEEGQAILEAHNCPFFPEVDAHAEDGQEEELAAYHKKLSAWVSAKVRAALAKAA